MLGHAGGYGDAGCIEAAKGYLLSQILVEGVEQLEKFTVAQVGCGVRGLIHVKGIVENPDYYEYVALCDFDIEKVKSAARMFNLDIPLYTDAEIMLRETKPDILIFITLPNVRLEMLELGVKYGVKGISLEKPMAESLQEATEMRDLCMKNSIKAVVCHQQKYLRQMQDVKKMVGAGGIGKISKIHVECQPWMAQLGTHFVDYALWMNGGYKAKSVVGHAHGKWILGDSHPSPDYILGEIVLENGTRVYLECGYYSEAHGTDGNKFGSDNRITIYGTHGYAWAETEGAWGMFCQRHSRGLKTGHYPGWHQQEVLIQAPYYADFGEWMRDDSNVHSCNIKISCHGYEILEAICLSALNHARIDLPLSDFSYEPVLERMRKEFPEVDTPHRVTY